MISVIIPTYNRAGTLERSMKSVLDQTYGAFELIVVDDGSTDDTRAVVERMDDRRIRYFRQENLGACAARNAGIDLAQGEYIAFQDSDDLWHPNKLARQLETIRSTGADILFCQMRRCNMGDGTGVIPQLDGTGFVAFRDLMVGISTQTLFMRREVTDRYRFDVTMPRFQDLEWLLRAVRTHTLYGMAEVLVDYYLSADSIGTSSRKMLDGVTKIRKKHPCLRKEAPNVNAVLGRLIRDEAAILRQNGDATYMKYLKTGLKMSDDPLDRIKSITMDVGLYIPLRAAKHIGKKLFGCDRRNNT